MLVHLSSDASASAQILRSSPWHPHPQILTLRSSSSDSSASDPQIPRPSQLQILRSSSSDSSASDPQILRSSHLQILRSLSSHPQILRSPDPQTLTSVTCHAVLCYAHVSPPRLVGITLPTDTPLRVVDAHGMLCCLAVCVTGCLAGCLSASLSLSLAVCPSVYPVPHVT